MQCEASTCVSPSVRDVCHLEYVDGAKGHSIQEEGHKSYSIEAEGKEGGGHKHGCVAVCALGVRI